VTAMRPYAFAILASSCLLGGAAFADDPSLEGKATATFQGTPLGLVVEQLQRQTETNIILAPGVNSGASVNLRVTDVELKDVLGKLQSRLKLERTAWAGAWVLHPKGYKLPEAGKPKGKGSRALDLPMTVNYSRSPVSTVAARVQARTKVPVSIPARVRLRLKRSGVTATLRLYRVPARNVLDHVALQGGLSWRLEKGRVTLVARKGAAAPEGPKTDLTMSTKGEADVDRLVARLSSASVPSREAAVRELILVGKPCLEKVGAVLTKTGDAKPTDSACQAALAVLAEIGDPSQHKAALHVFMDKTRATPIRIAAGDTLGAMGAEKATGDLIEALNDTESLLRAESARRALVMIGKPAMGPLLERYRVEIKRKKPTWGVIYRGLFVMGEVGTKEGKEELQRALKRTGRDPRSKSIRHHAAIGLGMSNDSKMIPALVTALEEENDFLIAKYITRSLTWLTNEKFPPDAVAWRAWWDGPGKRKFASDESADELLKRIAGGEIELEKNDKGTARLDETTEARIKRLIGQLANKDATKARAAENDLLAMGKAALPALRKASGGEGPAAKRAAALVLKIEAADEE
jgi:HEAT repeat protein